MKRFAIPLSAGLVGVLASLLACGDAPTFPNGTGAPERAPQYVDVIVRNLLDFPLDVWVDIGQDRTELGAVRAGGVEAVRVAPLGLTGGPARFVAIATTHDREIRSEPLDVMPGWTVEVTLDARGSVARHRADCDGGSGRCAR